MKKYVLIIVMLFVQTTIFSQFINYKFYEDFLIKYVSEEGYVDYDKIYENQVDLKKTLERFEEIVTSDSWSKNQKLSHWINVYNVYSIKLIVDNYPINSIQDINQSFELRFIPVDKQLVSLNYIEKEILSKTLDERIHFAINCASISCPNINRQAFYGDIIDSQLETAAYAFINDTSKNDINKREVKLSKIFDWFSADFLKNNSSIIEYVNKYSETKIKDTATIEYLKYNWSINSQKKFVSKAFLASK